jgi:hypothetical protein
LTGPRSLFEKNLQTHTQNTHSTHTHTHTRRSCQHALQGREEKETGSCLLTQTPLASESRRRELCLFRNTMDTPLSCPGIKCLHAHHRTSSFFVEVLFISLLFNGYNLKSPCTRGAHHPLRLCRIVSGFRRCKRGCGPWRNAWPSRRARRRVMLSPTGHGRKRSSLPS